MNLVLSEILKSNIVYSPAGQTLPLRSNIPQLEGEIIQAWIAGNQPSRLLEIGLGYGISSLFICDALQTRQNFTYHIIDPHQSTDWQSIGTYNLNRAGFQDRWILHEEPSEVCLPRMLEQGLRFDFALIDGFHTFDHTLVDFFYINRMLDVGGIVIFDDIQLPAIEKVIAYIATYPAYHPLALPDSFDKNTTVRVRRILNTPAARVAGFIKTQHDHRRWDWYHDF